MILRARIVVTMNGAPIPNGAVAIAGAEVSEVGTFRELSAHSSDQVVDLGDCALLPGLINAHCHLDYTLLRGRIAPQSSFAKWVQQINAAKRTLQPDDYVGSIRSGFEEALRFGTTSIVDFAAFPQLIARVPVQPIRTWWCAEMIDLRENIDPRNVAEQLSRDCAAWRGGIGLAPHAPFTASADLYVKSEAVARERRILLSTHLAESHDEMAMFRDGRGGLYDLLRELGRPMNDAGNGTPLAQMLPLLSSRWIVAHLNELTEDDFELLRRAGKFHIVHCPRSHRYFQHTRFALECLRQLGFNICIGTDSLASNDDLSLFAELRELLRTQPTVDPAEALEFVTTRAALAIGDSRLGRIRAGCYADLIAVPLQGERDLYTQLVHFSGEVPFVMINGETTRPVAP